MSFGARSKARECAVQMLFRWSIEEPSFLSAHATLLEDHISQYWQNFEVPVFAQETANHFVKNVIEYLPQIDEAIQKNSQNWRFERIAKVDLCILRLAVYELLFEQQTPEQVVINEAIELAKKFSTQEAHAFINGVLAGVVQSRM